MPIKKGQQCRKRFHAVTTTWCPVLSLLVWCSMVYSVISDYVITTFHLNHHQHIRYLIRVLSVSHPIGLAASFRITVNWRFCIYLQPILSVLPPFWIRRNVAHLVLRRMPLSPMTVPPEAAGVSKQNKTKTCTTKYYKVQQNFDKHCTLIGFVSVTTSLSENIFLDENF